MELLRTPDDHFDNLPDFPYQPNYLDYEGKRIHYLDEGEGEVILCLHGEPSWSYLYRKMIPILSSNYRVIAPDFLGFGRSDKYPDPEDYTYKMHLDTLLYFIEKMHLNHITIVVQDWGGLLGLGAVGQIPDRFARLVILNTFLPIGDRPMPEAFTKWKDFSKGVPEFPAGGVLQMGTFGELSDDVVAAYDAPFPDETYKAGARIFPSLVPVNPTDGGVKEMTKAREVLKQWLKPAFVMFSDKDPIMKGADKWFREHIPTAKTQPFVEIKDAGHFLQEDKGEEIAEHIKAFMERTSG